MALSERSAAGVNPLLLCYIVLVWPRL